MKNVRGEFIPRYEVNTDRDSYGEWSLYNIWDRYEMEEIPINGDSWRRDGYTRDRSYANRLCKEMNAFSDSPNLIYPNPEFYGES